MDTAISRIKRRVWEKIISTIKLIFNDEPDDPSSDKRRWPAIILAVSRIAKVKGRIISLISSIITINGIKINGVPLGVRCENRSLIKFIILYVIIPNQKDKDIDRQKLICLDAVKIYGNRPMKLLKKISIINLIKIIRLE